MFGFSMGRPKKTVILAVDVGTVSISAALAIRHGEDPKTLFEVIKVLRYFFQLIEPSQTRSKDKSDQVMRMFLGGFNKLFSDAFKLEKKVDTILISFSDPFFVEKKLSKEIARTNPSTPVTRSEISEILAEMEKDSQEQGSDLAMGGKEIFSVRVNGYPVKDAVGYKGRTLEMSCLFTFVSRFLKDYIEESREKFFPSSTLSYYSDTRVLWQVLKSTENLFETALIADIGGEMTSVFLVRGETLGKGPETIEHGKAFPFGVRTLERRLAAFMKQDFTEAEGIFRKYADGSLEEGLALKVSKILDSAMEDWWTLLKKSLSASAPPKKILLTGGGGDYKVFAESIKSNFKKSYNLDVEPKILRAEAFRDLFSSSGSLLGGADVILSALLLFAR